MRYKVTVAYDGTNFSGYQAQPKGRTVQGEIERSLWRMHKKQKVETAASGRTDQGVHALGQVFHFDSELRLPLKNWAMAINSQLPPDIRVVNVEEAEPDFHARHSSVKKEYRYKMYTGETHDVFLRNFAFHYPYRFNEQKMREALPYLLGQHDFTAMSSKKTVIENKVRTIYELEMTREGDELTFRIVGSGFLYNMVRIIVGTLLAVGQGKIEPSFIPEIIQQKNRRLAGKTAPAHGLYLYRVYY